MRPMNGINVITSKAMMSVEAFCEKRGFVYHDKGRGRYGFYSCWTFYKVVDNDTTVFSIEFTPVTHCSRNEIIIESSCGTYKGRVKDMEHLKMLLVAMGIDINDIDNADQRKVTSKYRWERKLALAKKIGDLLDEWIEWRRGKGFELVMEGEYLEIDSLYELTRTDPEKIADKVRKDYENNKFD